MKRNGVTLRIVRCGLMGAMLLAVKVALGSIPNCEMVTLLLILFAKTYGKDAYWAAAVFNLCELAYWGFGMWWVSYLYVWNLLVFLTLRLKSRIGDDFLMWAVFSAVFGLFFGSMFAVAYIPISANTAWAYWISGLPWDLWHGICNFVLMIALYKPLTMALNRINNRH